MAPSPPGFNSETVQPVESGYSDRTILSNRCGSEVTDPQSLSAIIRWALQDLDVRQPHVSPMFHFFPRLCQYVPGKRYNLLQRSCCSSSGMCLLSGLAQPSHSTTKGKDTFAFRLPYCNVPSIAVAACSSDIPTASAWTRKGAPNSWKMKSANLQESEA